MFKSQGLTDEEAKQNAKAVFRKAQAQSAEKVLQIEEIKVNKQSAELHGTAADNTAEVVATVRYGSQTDEIELDDREKALSELMEKYGVCEEEAANLLDMVEDKVGSEVDSAERADVINNNHERTPAPKVEVDVEEAPELPKAPTPKRR